MDIQKHLDWIQQGLAEKCEHSYFMVGRLTNELNTVSSNQDMVRFNVEPLCDDPKVFINNINYGLTPEYYIGIDNNQEEKFCPEYYDINSYNMEERENQWLDYLKDKLIVFNPRLQQSNTTNRLFRNLYITKLYDDDLKKYRQFTAIPRVAMSNSKFEQVISNQEYFTIENFDSQLYMSPELIICGNYAYRLRSDETEKMLTEPSNQRREAWKINDPESVIKIDLRKIDGATDFMLDGCDTVVLMEDSLRNLIMTSANVLDYNAVEQDSNPEVSKEQANEVAPVKSETTAESAADSDEVKFINALNRRLLDKNLMYEYADLVNFHTSVKTNFLTILSGMAGTGKTQLAYNYARMLNLSEDNKTLLFMPISPAYAEPSDVLGYLNPMNNNYVPAETGLVDFLKHADDNKNKMHMVIFDEMNLSQVEFWFSPFISILEKDDDDRYLQLYDENAVCANHDDYPSKIKIDRNVLFVGTVNSDETTKGFSDRLLDRTFVITLQKKNFIDLYNYQKEDQTAVELSDAICYDASSYLGWNMVNASPSYQKLFNGHENEIKFFDQFNTLLANNSQLNGISFRMLRNIGSFLANIPGGNNNPLIDRKRAFDMIICQTVMPKIRGTVDQLQKLILPQQDNQESEIVKLLQQYPTISSFDLVKQSVSRKAAALQTNGYTD